MTCRIDHSAPLVLPEFLCRTCHPIADDTTGDRLSVTEAHPDAHTIRPSWWPQGLRYDPRDETGIAAVHEIVTGKRQHEHDKRVGRNERKAVGKFHAHAVKVGARWDALRNCWISKTGDALRREKQLSLFAA